MSFGPRFASIIKPFCCGQIRVSEPFVDFAMYLRDVRLVIESVRGGRAPNAVDLSSPTCLTTIFSKL